MYKDYRIFLFTDDFNSSIIIIQHKFVEVSKNLASLQHQLLKHGHISSSLIAYTSRVLCFLILRGHTPALVNQCKRHSNSDQPLTISVRETQDHRPTNQHLALCIRKTQDDRSTLGTRCIKNTRTQTKTCHSVLVTQTHRLKLELCVRNTITRTNTCHLL